MQLWVAGEMAPELAVVTQIAVFPMRSECLAVVLGGRHFLKWGPLLEDLIRRWATANGCSVLVGGGRRQWRAVLARMGWKATDVVMEK